MLKRVILPLLAASVSLSKKSTRKTTAGLKYDVDPPLRESGMSEWWQEKVLTEGKTADAAASNINRVSRTCGVIWPGSACNKEPC